MKAYLFMMKLRIKAEQLLGTWLVQTTILVSTPASVPCDRGLSGPAVVGVERAAHPCVSHRDYRHWCHRFLISEAP